LLALLAGCGSRTPTPQLLKPAAPGGFALTRYPRAGFKLAVPRNWTTAPVHPPLVALITSDGAVIALWRYPHVRPPQTADQLQELSRRLIAQARGRDRTLRVFQSSTVQVDGYPAVELQTEQRIGAQLRRVSSTHLFGRGVEMVLEEYAPQSLFGALDRTVFSPVRRSLAALSL
jgi:hypothetical protein